MSLGTVTSDDESEGGLLRRWASAWSRFWFTPADPTPLCFMRICAGILTLYVHIAYTFDLVDFFGPRAWCDLKFSNENRRGVPHVRVRDSWVEEPQPFLMPPDPTQREAVRIMINRILARTDYRECLDFMYRLGIVGEERNEVLRYLRDALPTDPALRNELLKPFVENKLPPEGLEQLPRFFQRHVSPESRQQLVAEIERFADLFPPRDPERRIMFDVLLETDPRSWHALQEFIMSMSNVPAEERDAELEYQATWGVPSSMIYAKGLPTYSPWFYVSDVRWLWTLHGIHLFIIVLFTLGMYTRVTSVMTWLIGLSYINRAQPYLFGQDTMMNLALLYLMISPCGAKWSLDRYMARQRAAARGETLPSVQPSVSAGFTLKLLQVQFCLMYFSAGLSKLKGTSWWNGTALFGCLANAEFAPMHVDAYQEFLHWLCSHRPVWEIFMTSAAIFTLITEISFPWAVWTSARPLLVAASILLHTGIAILMGLSVFSLFMFTLVAAFIPADAINWMFAPADMQPSRSP